MKLTCTKCPWASRETCRACKMEQEAAERAVPNPTAAYTPVKELNGTKLETT